MALSSHSSNGQSTDGGIQRKATQYSTGGAGSITFTVTVTARSDYLCYISMWAASDATAMSAQNYVHMA